LVDEWAPAAVASGERSSFRVVGVLALVLVLALRRRDFIVGVVRRLVVRILLRWARVETGGMF
jgi:hypothetical protein